MRRHIDDDAGRLYVLRWSCLPVAFYPKHEHRWKWSAKLCATARRVRMNAQEWRNRHSNDDVATIKDSFLALLIMDACAAGAWMVDNLYL